MNTNYDLELEKAITAIKKHKPKATLLQLPDGLKPLATQIADKLQSETNTQIMIWQSTCFGACDVPLETKDLGVDLIIQWGHSAWPYKRKDVKILG